MQLKQLIAFVVD